MRHIVTLFLLLSCDPPEVERRADDTIACHLKGFHGEHVVCRSLIPFEGGRCTCTGVDLPLVCEPILESTETSSKS